MAASSHWQASAAGTVMLSTSEGVVVYHAAWRAWSSLVHISAMIRPTQWYTRISHCYARLDSSHHRSRHLWLGPGYHAAEPLGRTGRYTSKHANHSPHLDVDRTDHSKVYEKSHSPGGVWRDAKWAGASVDVPIQLYSLWSDPVQWKSFYASQPEVLAYWLSLIDKHKLADRIHTDTEVVRAVWNDQAAEYEVTLRRSGRRRGTGADKEEEDKEEAKEQEWTVKANVLISANGPLSKPVIPKFKGLDQFQGQYFHNLHWDETVALEGKRIALVGNGSSGVQIAPGLAALKGAHLTHVIRSGGYFYPKGVCLCLLRRTRFQS